jgi:type IV pilus assembly protein PilW
MDRTPRASFPPRPAQAGFTLVELMISLAIGLAVAGALLAAYLASVQSSRHSEALSQMTEDATTALALMRQQIAQAGFSVARGAADGRLVQPAFPAVLGCEAAGFRDLNAGVLAPPACEASRGPAAPDALEVAYESAVLPGPSANAVLGGSADQPLDCLGNTFPKTHDALGDYWLADSKFYVEGGNLMCHGPGNPAGAPLAQNVEDLQVVYGLAAAAPAPGDAVQVAYYDAAPAVASADWARVVSVQVCLQVRSASRAVESGAASTLGSWIDCRNAVRTSADGYLRRTFSTTIVLQNRLR